MVLSIKLNVVFGPSFEYRNLNGPMKIRMFKKWYSAKSTGARLERIKNKWQTNKKDRKRKKMISINSFFQNVPLTS